jgi:hypothetical protein
MWRPLWREKRAQLPHTASSPARAEIVFENILREQSININLHDGGDQHGVVRYGLGSGSYNSYGSSGYGSGGGSGESADAAWSLG